MRIFILYEKENVIERAKDRNKWMYQGIISYYLIPEFRPAVAAGS
jgi:hypothetical protein